MYIGVPVSVEDEKNVEKIRNTVKLLMGDISNKGNKINSLKDKLMFSDPKSVLRPVLLEVSLIQRFYCILSIILAT